MEALEQRAGDHLRRGCLEKENEEKNGKGTGWSQTGTAASQQEI